MTVEAKFTAVAKALSTEANVTHGQDGKKGFGSSALKVDGKIFAMVSSAGAFVVKLPKPRVDALESAGKGCRFDPGHGRLMKEWLVLNKKTSQDWIEFAREALHFVRGASEPVAGAHVAKSVAPSSTRLRLRRRT